MSKSRVTTRDAPVAALTWQLQSHDLEPHPCHNVPLVTLLRSVSPEV